MSIASYELALREAKKALRAATTPDEYRKAWREYGPTLGQRTFARLFSERHAPEVQQKRDRE